MKTITKFENTLLWHNMKKAFFSLQMLAMTGAIPVLLYIGLTHNDAGLQEKYNKTVNPVINVATVKATSTGNGTSVATL